VERRTWAEAARTVTVPATIHFQRRANIWFLALKALSRRMGCALRGFDPIDAIQQPVLIDAGNRLANLHVLRELATRRPGLHLTDVPAEASRLLSDVPGLVRTDPPSYESALRLWSWRARRAMQLRTSVGAIPPRPKGRVVVAMPITGLHLADMLPEARALRERGVETFFALIDGRFTAQIAREGFPHAGLLHHRFADAVRWAAAVPLVARLEAQGETLSRTLLELDEVERRVLLSTTRDALRESIPVASALAAAAQALLGSLKPDLIRVGNPYTLEGRVPARVAQFAGIPTAVVEHGAIFPNDPKWQDCPASLVCAWGQPSRRALLSNGVPESHIAITGSPRFDAVFQTYGTSQRRPSPDDGILVVASGPGDQTRLEHHYAFIRILHAAADATPNLRWRVKLHPKDSADFYSRPEGSRLEIVHADKNRHGQQIFELLGTARAAVTERSSAAIDAMALGVPVITVNVWPEGKGITGIEFLERGCTRMVRTGEELAREARRAWAGELEPHSDAAAKTYAAEHLANPGQAAHSVATAMLGLMEQRR
jgi:hypothetical protein